MQPYVIRYVEDLKARIEPTGCSINTALQAILPSYEKAHLLKLRDAADDLQRIVELELQRRDEVVEPCGDCGAVGDHHCPAWCDRMACEICFPVSCGGGR